MSWEFVSNLLLASVRMATPLIFLSLAELYSQRAGLVHIGLEGLAGQVEGRLRRVVVLAEVLEVQVVQLLRTGEEPGLALRDREAEDLVARGLLARIALAGEGLSSSASTAARSSFFFAASFSDCSWSRLQLISTAIAPGACSASGCCASNAV